MLLGIAVDHTNNAKCEYYLLGSESKRKRFGIRQILQPYREDFFFKSSEKLKYSGPFRLAICGLPYQCIIIEQPQLS